MSATGWRCTVCKRERLQPDDALPALEDTITPRWKRGRCKKCRSIRFFEPAAGSARDVELGRELRERGMARAESTQQVMSPGWTERFDATVHKLALQRVEFTSEDVTAEVGFPPSGSASAIGARMNAAAKRGLINWTGQMRQAERPNQHAALLKIWRGA